LVVATEGYVGRLCVFPVLELGKRMATSLVWFRNDLRLSDHPALHEAVSSGDRITCVYVHDEGVTRALGGASRWWLHGALAALRSDIEARGGVLVCVEGDAGVAIPDLAGRMKARGVYWNDRAEAGEAAQDGRIEEALKKKEIEVHRGFAMLLRRPGGVTTQAGGRFQVYGSYWKAARKLGDPPEPLPAPGRWQGAAVPKGVKVMDEGALLPRHPDWAGGLRGCWAPGEEAGAEHLDDFVRHGLKGYDATRNDPSGEGTSRLSAYLRFGEVSPRQVWWAVRDKGSMADGFLSELGWRDFAYDTLNDKPELATRNCKERFDRFRWRRSRQDLRAWQRGRTGVPIVDAGMRQLWETGWMHNRVRMIAASFLVKHLLIDWRAGERWFWDTLVDADPANNPVNWQWVAGSGIEATPYFRVFNPVLQAGKFDPHGDYVRRWVPELKGLSDREVHTPWEGAGVKGYPAPVVDLKGAKDRALEVYRATA